MVAFLPTVDIKYLAQMDDSLAYGRGDEARVQVQIHGGGALLLAAVLVDTVTGHAAFIFQQFYGNQFWAVLTASRGCSMLSF